MRVLVTRPEQAGLRTARRLTDLGYDPVRMPLFDSFIVATPEDLPPAENIAGFIATSARALALFEPAGGLAPGLRDLPVHVVGPATADAARKAGFGDIRVGKGTAQALAEAITSHQPNIQAGSQPTESDTNVRVLVYLAGMPRTTAIEDVFARAGRPLMVLECYQMREISYTTDFIISGILSPAPDLVLLYSANAARRFCRLFDGNELGERLESTRFICLSQTIATELPDLWQRRTITAERPNEDSLLASLAALG
ncbi:uroporphyrinogen-III synthase [Hoeflea sp. IMCC20628]|uniref:uroporphyrinogen-III synthase n=1 Tax=Hoeflea sp. IMCC20628 TaxID=1620421 RepID=UPI00063BF0F8|nr:uroporphyrinogen-III synthase [Hoeflea sp. IMCC20628]AKI02975.1 uroporphyrinogen-III synthase [Hoeflea sp. IMCC20628]